MKSQDARLVEVLETIMRYLDSHPDAADTVEGIAEWWLPRALCADVPLVEQALARLLGQGLVRRQSNIDRHVLYSAARKPHAEAQPSTLRPSGAGTR
jgi:hypothetical protein